VDNSKILHTEESVVADVINQLENKFGKMKVLWGETVENGKHIEFLGMALTFQNDRILDIDMSTYLGSAIDDFGNNGIIKPVSTPAYTGLFVIDKNTKRVSTKKCELFHSIVYKLLYVSLHGRRDIQLITIFLASRVNEITTEDFKNYGGYSTI